MSRTMKKYNTNTVFNYCKSVQYYITCANTGPVPGTVLCKLCVHYLHERELLELVVLVMICDILFSSLETPLPTRRAR